LIYLVVKNIKKSMKVTYSKPSQNNNCNQTRNLSKFSKLNLAYCQKNSDELHQFFKAEPTKWKEYHKLFKQSEDNLNQDQDMLPYKKIIKYIDEIEGNRSKTIVDLGCGKARIFEHFKNNERFNILNFDHVACNENVISKNIKNTDLEDCSVDYAILCLAMWGNCQDYIKECYRILDRRSSLLIIEPWKRWCDNDQKENKLVKMLENNNFKCETIDDRFNENEFKKFMFIEAVKN